MANYISRAGFLPVPSFLALLCSHSYECVNELYNVTLA